MENYEEKVIIDTDCRVDDAQAILMALNKEFSKRVEMINVTCCSGNVLVDEVLVNVFKVVVFLLLCTRPPQNQYYVSICLYW